MHSIITKVAYMLKINVKKTLGALSLNLNIEIPARGVTAIFGRSGAGKSSLINLVAGLVTPQSGTITLNDNVLFDSEQKINLPPEKRHIGYVFQEHRLFPHYTVEKNLKYGCKRFNSSYFLQIVELLGIQNLLERFPLSLSGGEKQRVAIGRALLSNPDILLMDEPLSALDLRRKQELLNYLDQLSSQIEIPILYVTHSLDEIIRLADQVILIEQGQIMAFNQVKHIWQHAAFQQWLPEQYPLSLLELPIKSHQTDYQMLELSLGTQSVWVSELPRYQLNDNVRITINSKDVSITLAQPQNTSIRNILQGKICQIQQQSQQVNVEVDVEGQKIWASISLWAFNDLQLSIEQAVYLQIKSVSL
ncbi:molybdenum ABC transporter ATP-binding protein ModC [Haemophilus paraphrohaemolyticus]